MRVCVSLVRRLVVISFPPRKWGLKDWITNGLDPYENRPGDARPVSPGTLVCVFVTDCAEQPLLCQLPSAVNARRSRDFQPILRRQRQGTGFASLSAAVTMRNGPARVLRGA